MPIWAKLAVSSWKYCPIVDMIEARRLAQKKSRKWVATRKIWKYLRIQIGIERLTKCDHFRKHLDLHLKKDPDDFEFELLLNHNKYARARVR